MMWSAQLQILGDMCVAMLLGGLIGWEREYADKPAGLRTHMLVAGTSALLVGLSQIVAEGMTASGTSELETDPTRIIQAIVIGIGFLGAGTILQRGRAEGIEGLTTGASLLLAAALGICAAAGQIALACGAAVLALTVLHVLGRLERRLQGRRRRREEE